jgi:predicted O-methyltransferase YrrM
MQSGSCWISEESPLNISRKLTSIVDRLYIAVCEYDHKLYLDQQSKIFGRNGLDYYPAKQKVAQLYKEYEQFADPMSSEHHVLFAAIAQKGGINNILEIGTFNGKNAAFLATLFPGSNITTLDLPNNDDAFSATYNRQTDNFRQRFIEERDALLARYVNISFLQENSLKLTLRKDQKYDLIWVDGAHGYPVLSADITNAIRLLNPYGYLLCDDIFMTLKNSDEMYCSTAGFETLSAFSGAGIIIPDYVYKRVQKPFGLKRFRKYIAIARHVHHD